MSIAEMNSTTQAVATMPGPKKRSLLVVLADKYELEPAKFLDTVKGTVFDPKGTDAELIAFLIVCNQYDLDPFRREIYAFPKKGGGIQPVVGIDGWAAIVNRQSAFDGVEFSYDVKDGNATAITASIFRKDRSRPTSVTEFLKECKRNTEPWNAMPQRMLRHKAFIQAARISFNISGIIDTDDADHLVRQGVLLNPPNYQTMPAVEAATPMSITANLKAAMNATADELKREEFEVAAEAEKAKPAKKSQPAPNPDADLTDEEILSGLNFKLMAANTVAEVNKIQDSALFQHKDPLIRDKIEEACKAERERIQNQ